MLGGIAAFFGALALGPRIGRFDKETGMPVDIKGHSIPVSCSFLTDFVCLSIIASQIYPLEILHASKFKYDLHTYCKY